MVATDFLLRIQAYRWWGCGITGPKNRSAAKKEAGSAQNQQKN
jgi:hypothetical protein